MIPLASEIQRRDTGTEQVLALLQSRPHEWISWQDFAAIAACAWRTRISDARKILRTQGYDVEWNKRRSSAYRLVPLALGRDATLPTALPGYLFAVHKQG